MKLFPSNLYHIYNRSNNKELIFSSDESYRYFLKKISKYLYKVCDILSYCLMPDHFHLLVHTMPDFDDVKFSKSLGLCLSSFAKGINNKFERHGSLFQQHTKFKCLTEDKKSNINHALVCFHYIHQNPMKAGLVNKLEDWEYSSFKDYAGKRNDTLCRREIAQELLGIPVCCEEFYRYSYEIIDENKLKKIF